MPQIMAYTPENLLHAPIFSSRIWEHSFLLRERQQREQQMLLGATLGAAEEGVMLIDATIGCSMRTPVLPA